MGRDEEQGVRERCLAEAGHPCTKMRSQRRTAGEQQQHCSSGLELFHDNRFFTVQLIEEKRKQHDGGQLQPP